MSFPMEAFDVRGVVGTLTYYPSDPTVPALMIERCDNRNGDAPHPLSVNLSEYGWYPDGLQIAVKEYEPWALKEAQYLVNLGVLERGERVKGQFDSGWRVYRILPEHLKAGVADAWAAHVASINGEPIVRPDLDTSPEKLRSLTAFYLRRYEERMHLSNARPAELRQLISLWLEVEAKDCVFTNCSPAAQREIIDALEDKE